MKKKMEAEDKKKKKRNNKKKNQKAAAAAADTISNGVQVSGNGQVPNPADNAETNGTERVS